MYLLRTAIGYSAHEIEARTACTYNGNIVECLRGNLYSAAVEGGTRFLVELKLLYVCAVVCGVAQIEVGCNNDEERVANTCLTKTLGCDQCAAVGIWTCCRCGSGCSDGVAAFKGVEHPICGASDGAGIIDGKRVDTALAPCRRLGECVVAGIPCHKVVGCKSLANVCKTRRPL